MGTATSVQTEAMPITGPPRIWATPAALDTIIHLRSRLGPLHFRQTAGHSHREVHLVASPVPARPEDVVLGAIGGAHFFLDRELDHALDCPDFELDVGPARLLDGEHGVRAQYQLVCRVLEP